MRILWIGKAAQDGTAGDEIYDRKLIQALVACGLDIDRIHPDRVTRMREIGKLISGVPYYRARYASRSNVERLRQAAAGYDAVICSWEPFDRLAFGLGLRPVQILHNVSSRSLPSMFPRSLPVQFAANRLARWESRAYGSGRFAALVVLSRQDEAYAKGVARNTPVIYAPPGLPSLASFGEKAGFRPEMVISGTYHWSVKRRDILQFADEWRSVGPGIPIYSDKLPAKAEALLRPRRIETLEPASALRLGLVTDRFEAGHKLKASAYIAMNAIVVSFANLMPEYSQIEDASFFVRQIRTVADISAIAREFSAADPDRLRRRWVAFQKNCSNAFSWDRSADAVAQSLAARGAT